MNKIQFTGRAGFIGLSSVLIDAQPGTNDVGVDIHPHVAETHRSEKINTIEPDLQKARKHFLQKQAHSAAFKDANRRFERIFH
jgi:UDP-N-acetyl-D-mannosaminuronate dehydrogenase